MYSDLTYIVIVVLVPLIPAFLLYKYLPPGRTEVGGPFKGLDIKLSGAFAAYFLVVLIVTSLLVFLIKEKPTASCPPCPQPEPHQYEVYTVTGKVDLSGGNNDGAKLDYRQINLSLAPPERTVRPDGTFSFEIPVRPGQKGEPEFPDLLVDYADPKYETATIHLKEKPNPPGEYSVTYSRDSKTIDISPLIHLGAATQAYRPTAIAQPITEASPR
jgi:hypothetical protein